MTRTIIIVAFVFLLCAGSASAEFYKYLDEKGNVHFTDDFNKVPAEQRERVRGYEEYRQQENPVASPTQKEPAGGADSDEVASRAAPDEGEPHDFDDRLKALDQRKAELASEYEALMRENAHLNDIKKTVKNRADADRYNEGVRSLNAKLQEHDRKRKEFFSDVEEYNARVGQANQARRKSTPTAP